jgi:RNA polymerase sigma-70 factor (ECF subfamily)
LDLGDIPDPSLGASPIDEASPIDGERLQLALNELPEEFRLVLVMFYFEECTYREIADKLEIPLGTVMSRLSRGKQRLRERLADDDRRDVPDAARHRVPDNTRPENSNARVIPRT